MFQLGLGDLVCEENQVMMLNIELKKIKRKNFCQILVNLKYAQEGWNHKTKTNLYLKNY